MKARARTIQQHAVTAKASFRKQQDTVQLWMAVVVTFAIASPAVYIVLSGKYEQDSLKWAIGALGTLLGYWLKR